MNRRQLFFPFLLLLLLTGLPSPAQFNHQKFITYTTADGLTDNYVMKVATDKKGFTWVATRNGISRFDGAVFTNYSTAHGLRSSWVTDVVVDSRGTVWVSTEWGLCYYNEATDRFVYLNPVNEVVVLYSGPLALQGDALWMAAENGLLKVDTKTKTYSFVTKLPIPDPQCVAMDAAGAVWIGTRGHGFYIWKAGRLQNIHHPTVPVDAHLMDFQQDGNAFWCATSEGLLKIENETDGTLYRSGPAATAVDALTFVTRYPAIGDSMLLCGTYTKRIAFFNKRQNVFTEVFSGSPAQMHGLPDAIIHDGNVDKDVLWIGSDAGLTMLNTSRQDNATYLLSGDNRFSGSLVKKMFPVPEQPQKRWLLLNNPGGLALYNASTQRIERSWLAPTSCFYEAALPLPDAGFILVHQKGIDLFRHTTGIVPLYTEKKQRYFSAALDAQANIWVGTGDGLMRYAPANGKADYFACRFTGTPVENSSFTFAFLAKDVVADGRGRVWVASSKYGLFCFDAAAQTFTPFRQPSTAAYETKNRCGSLAFDARGGLWMGNGSGLTLFDTAKKTFRNYGQLEGLQSSYVYAVSADEKGNVVGRGNSGVFRFDATKNFFTNYPVPVRMSASLLEQEVSVVNGEAVVGFNGGYSVYRPQRQRVRTAPPVYISAFYAGNERLQGSALTLGYRQNNLRIDYAAVEYAHPETVTYRYRLAGGDSAWVNAGRQRSVQFTELSPAAYEFQVVAVTDQGLTSRPATFRFVINPPFWQTGWAFALSGLAAAAGLTWFVRYRIKAAGAAQEQRQQRQQLKLEQYRQQLELEKVSSFFSRSLLDKNTAQDVLDDVAKNLIGQLGFENCMIYMWDDPQQHLLQRTGVGRKGLLEGKTNPERYHLAKGEGIVGATVESGRPVLVNDTAKDPRYVTLDGERCGSELCVPLFQNGAVTGAINVEQEPTNHFSARHVQTLTTIATLTAHKLNALAQSQALHQKQLELSQASRKLSETELSLLRSQMNPHFIFNSLNSIQKYIWEAKQEDAAEYLTKFARLMRSTLENSSQKLIPLQKELTALKLYLELEHRRSGNKFDYALQVAEELNAGQVLLPPLLLQPYIENSIWHGLGAVKRRGRLVVDISSANGHLICTVDDDGVGRKASALSKSKDHTSMALNISAERLRLMQTEPGVAASVAVTDKVHPDGSAAGTTVTVTLPLILHHADLRDH